MDDSRTVTFPPPTECLVPSDIHERMYKLEAEVGGLKKAPRKPTNERHQFERPLADPHDPSLGRKP